MDEETEERLGPALSAALAKKGYDTLTPIQQAVLDPSAEGRDLRLASQTGSGKTVAVGFLLRGLVDTPLSSGEAPRALVVTPTRELAKQVTDELGWLYASLGARLACLTGGASYVLERRALSSHPAVVVGTPGRLLDHLDRGALDPSNVAAVVLDEADRMLDMGFREEIEAIFSKLPEVHRTHLVSATFPREVQRLADKVQEDPLLVEGTKLGQANVDIEHVLHVIDSGDRFAALVNVLLSDADARAIVFAKTRADVSDIAQELSREGFKVASLSGEMQQRERNRALTGFREGTITVLVATDVAARGLDVAAVDRVIHFSPPSEPDAYTHRSGRTGRAGRRGTSHVIMVLPEVARVRRVLDQARVRYRFEPVPTRESILAAARERAFEELTRDEDDATDDRFADLAERLVATGDPERVIARLLARADFGRGPAPRDVRVVAPPTGERKPERHREHDRRDRDRAFEPRGQREHREPREAREPREQGARAPRGDVAWVSFRVTWGKMHGADSRRMLAMVCRRGGIHSKEVGAIRIGPTWSIVEVDARVAERFQEAASVPDERDRRVKIHPDRGPRPHHAEDRPSKRAPKAPPRDRPSRAGSASRARR